MALRASILILLASFVFYVAIIPTDAHSFISVPRGDYRTLRKAECRMGGPPHAPNDKCPGPCIQPSSFIYDKKAKNVTTFRRGQKTEIVWSRNNHKGGFVRLSLVPAKQRMNRTAHNMNAFWYGCYTMGERPCNSPQTCGSDTGKIALGAIVDIPKCFPDGAYVLGWVWFGGVKFTGESYFGDYYSCTYVLIKGGDFADICHPTFDPEKGSTSCISSTDKIGVCPREPCDGPRGTPMVPVDFKNGTPQPISGPGVSRPKTPTVSSESPTPSISYTTSPSSSITPSSSAMVTPSSSLSMGATSVAPSVSPTMSISSTPSVTMPEGGIPSVTMSEGSTPSVTMSVSGTPSVSPVPSVSPTGSAWVSELRLMDVVNGTVISTKFPGIVHVSRDVPAITFVAITEGAVISVEFRLNHRKVGEELSEPYAMFGNVDGELYGWTNPIYNRWMKIQIIVTSATQKQKWRKFWVKLVRK